MILGQTIMMFLIFATQENVNNLIQYREWFADGTFNVAPYLCLSDIYHPLFIQRYNTSNGLLFLRRKNKATEEEFRPGSIMCDFEKVFHQALKNVFGENVNIIGYYFHLFQIIW